MSAARTCAVVLAALIGAIPLAPTEHAHEIEDHGHVTWLVHRHVRAHDFAMHADHQRRHLLDHPDAPVTTIVQAFTVPAALHGVAPVRSLAVVLPEPPASTCGGSVEFIERLIHGPPRAPTPQRGPPSSHLS